MGEHLVCGHDDPNVANNGTSSLTKGRGIAAPLIAASYGHTLLYPPTPSDCYYLLLLLLLLPRHVYSPRRPRATMKPLAIDSAAVISPSSRGQKSKKKFKKKKTTTIVTIDRCGHLPGSRSRENRHTTSYNRFTPLGGKKRDSWRLFSRYRDAGVLLFVQIVVYISIKKKENRTNAQGG